MAGLPQHMPGLLCQEIPSDARLHLEVQLVADPRYSQQFELFSQRSGTYLRRAGSEDPLVGPDARNRKRFKVGPQEDSSTT